MIRCVVFDFDGTLVLSNAIKRDGFFAIANDFPNGSGAMSALLDKSPGDRFAIFRDFAKSFGADAGALTSRYSAWCEERIASCPERAGASAILENLRRRAIKIYVNSATPEEALCAVIRRHYPTGMFDGVMGGYGRKVENLKAILSAENLTPKDLLMVGDGTDDRDAACAVGCAFVGLTEGTLAASAAPGRLIAGLSAVEEIIFDEHKLEFPSS